eukprot:Lithocolla_globosa_v1_NODE_2781_length_1870_cov_5.496419.p4 type:complete len:127 gc:universal NODE_2781_length_1870_cov_5.496419:798-418(-)
MAGKGMCVSCDIGHLSQFRVPTACHFCRRFDEMTNHFKSFPPPAIILLGPFDKPTNGNPTRSTGFSGTKLFQRDLIKVLGICQGSLFPLNNRLISCFDPTIITLKFSSLVTGPKLVFPTVAAVSWK